jgi:hypothetical protein
MELIRLIEITKQYVLVILIVGASVLPSINGNAKNACGQGKQVFPTHKNMKVEVFISATAASPSQTILLGNDLCALEEKAGRYYIIFREGKFWVPTWYLMTPGPQPQLQRSPEPSQKVGASIAASPHIVTDESTTAPSAGRSPKIEDLLRKGGEPPSTK